YTHHGNWKMQAENGVDGYHVDTVHASYFSIAANRAKQAATEGAEDKVKAIDPLTKQPRNGTYTLGNGHQLFWIDVPNFRDRGLGMQYDSLVARVGETRAQWMAARLRQLVIYPNVILFDGISTQMRHWRPLSQDETEVTVNCIAPVGEPAEARKRRLRQYEDFYGASGLATPDDLTEFDACQDGYYGIKSAWQDYNRGMTQIIDGPDDLVAEITTDVINSAPHMADEGLYHHNYRTWLKLLTTKMPPNKEPLDGNRPTTHL
ncbi:MAG: SRPBCC family protein, partial [Gammaproteobacteria bacterium]